jgi:hypothetical protein
MVAREGYHAGRGSRVGTCIPTLLCTAAWRVVELVVLRSPRRRRTLLLFRVSCVCVRVSYVVFRV